MWFDKHIKNDSIVKSIRHSKSMEGSVPHFYQFLSRVFKDASQHTPQYLDRYYAWDELEDYLKLAIKKQLDDSDPDNEDTWGNLSNRHGVRVNWDGLTPTLDRAYYNAWRKDKAGKQSQTNDWKDLYAQNNVYRVIKKLISKSTPEYEKRWYT